jgi:hypothetical protein
MRPGSELGDGIPDVLPTMTRAPLWRRWCCGGSFARLWRSVVRACRFGHWCGGSRPVALNASGGAPASRPGLFSWPRLVARLSWVLRGAKYMMTGDIRKDVRAVCAVGAK